MSRHVAWPYKGVLMFSGITCSRWGGIVVSNFGLVAFFVKKICLKLGFVILS